jgi:CBS domain containing-hemolysin-like protein
VLVLPDTVTTILSGLGGPLLLLLLVLANAFFVLGEFSLLTVERGRVERLAAAGDRRARRALAALQQLTLQLSGAQLGITLTSLLVGFIAEPALAGLLFPLMGELPLVSQGLAVVLSASLAFVLATVMQMVVGEQVPKSLAIAHPLRFTLLATPLLRIFCSICRPLIAVLNGGANAVVRALGVESRQEIAAARSISELEVVIRTSASRGTLDRPTARLLLRTGRFRRKTAGDALLPRVMLVALPQRATAAELLGAALESGHQRFPVYGRNLDDILGIASLRDALGVEAHRRGRVRLDELMRPPLVVPGTVPLDQVLSRMRAGSVRMAVVLDEYGGTAGIVTAEDLMEEVAGEIEARPPRLPEYTGRGYLLPGAAPLEQVLDETGLELPEGDYVTVAGFLLDRLGELAEPGDSLELDGWELRVMAVDGHRIAWVAVISPQPQHEVRA